MFQIIYFNLTTKGEEVDEPADTEKAACEKIKDSHSGLAYIKLVNTEQSEKEPKEISCKFAFHNQSV